MIDAAGIENDVHSARALFADLALELLAVHLEDETLGHLTADLSLLIPDGARPGEPGSGVALDLQRGFLAFPAVSRTLFVALGPALCLCYGITGSRFSTSYSSRPRATSVSCACFGSVILSALRFAGGLLPDSLLASDACCKGQERDQG